MEAFAELGADNGQVFRSLWFGPIPEGRGMFDDSAEDAVRLAAGQGLLCRLQGERLHQG